MGLKSSRTFLQIMYGFNFASCEDGKRFFKRIETSIKKFGTEDPLCSLIWLERK